MLLLIFDILTTLLQSYMFVFSCNNVTSAQFKLSKTKSCILCGILFFNSFIFTNLQIQVHIGNLLMEGFALMFILLFYRDAISDALLGFSLSYAILTITSYPVLTLYKYVFSKMNSPASNELRIFLFVYLQIWLLYIIAYISRKYILNAAMITKNIKFSNMFFVFFIFSLLILDSIRPNLQNEMAGSIFKLFMFLFASIIYIFSIIYFAKVSEKSKKIETLNKALNDKIIELRKIKHDYGSEISSLYGLYQLGRIDRVGDLLKSIIEKHQSVNTSINVSIQASPLVTSILQSAASKGINLAVFDSCIYENLKITDEMLLKLIANIIKNSVDALENVVNPMITYKSFSRYDGITIDIINNGPKIPEEIKNKIFDTGFSTKGNASNDRGYGLSIVKDIINSCGGKIFVKSDDKETHFSLEIPYRVS